MRSGVKNAQKLVEAGLGFVIPQSMVSPVKLLDVIALMKQRQVDIKKVEKIREQTPQNALETMIDDIEKMLV